MPHDIRVMPYSDLIENYSTPIWFNHNPLKVGLDWIQIPWFPNPTLYGTHATWHDSIMSQRDLIQKFWFIPIQSNPNLRKVWFNQMQQLDPSI